MSDRAPSRRTMLAGMAAVPTLVVAACPASAPAAGAPDLAAAILAHKRAEAISDRYDKAVYWPAKARFDAAVAGVPHHTTAHGFAAAGGNHLTFSTDDDTAVRMARRIVADMDACKLRSAADTDYDRTMRELVRLADEREAAVAAARADAGMGRICDRSNMLCDRVADAAYAVAELPVHTPADLAMKVAFIDGQDMWETAREYIVADALRLAGAA